MEELPIKNRMTEMLVYRDELLERPLLKLARSLNLPAGRQEQPVAIF